MGFLFSGVTQVAREKECSVGDGCIIGFILCVLDILFYCFYWVIGLGLGRQFVWASVTALCGNESLGINVVLAAYSSLVSVNGPVTLLRMRET